MALVSSSGFAHVRLTVTDIARSKAFYDQVLTDAGIAILSFQDPDDINIELTAPLS